MSIIIYSEEPNFKPTIIKYAQDILIHISDAPSVLYDLIEWNKLHRWPEAEPIIMQDPSCVYWYALKIIKGRWPEAEPYIIKDPYWVFQYARYILQRRLPEAEPYIIQDLQLAYYYAKDVIRGRWPEAEPTIMQNPGWAYEYARWVIHDRWPEAEPIIKQDPELWKRYLNHNGKIHHRHRILFDLPKRPRR